MIKTENEFVTYFLNKYPQFDVVKEKIADYYNIALSRFKILKAVGSYNIEATCLIVAHFLTVYEIPEDISAGAYGSSSGIINSASIGDVSISMQSKPINDMFEDFMASTIYGRDFLAWLASVGGSTLIN